MIFLQIHSLYTILANKFIKVRNAIVIDYFLFPTLYFSTHKCWI
jgi:hypothetical protein